MITINKIIWGVATIFLTIGGLYYTKKLNFVQFRFKYLLKSFSKGVKKGITPFQSLSISLGATIGVGSIAGIALAIYHGGVGSIFWIWVISIITSANSFVENLLAIVFQNKDKEPVGGPPHYISKGLNLKKISIIYAILVLIAYIAGFLQIQVNTITVLITDSIKISPIIIGITIATLSILIIVKGIKNIAKISEKLVPIMSSIYIIISSFIIITNIDKIPAIISSIISEAFNFKSLTGGFISTLIIGVQRGIFSNEAGVGTSAIASGATSNNPINQGTLGVIATYFTTFIICTSTAIIILTSPYETLNLTNVNGIELAEFAMNYHLGIIGVIILNILIIFFSFTTIISGYYYGESSLKYIIKTKIKQKTNILKIITFIVLILGSIVSSKIIWTIIDTFVGILAIINTISIIKLKDVVLEEHYIYQRRINYDWKRMGRNSKR